MSSPQIFLDWTMVNVFSVGLFSSVICVVYTIELQLMFHWITEFTSRPGMTLKAHRRWVGYRGSLAVIVRIGRFFSRGSPVFILRYVYITIMPFGPKYSFVLIQPHSGKVVLSFLPDSMMRCSYDACIYAYGPLMPESAKNRQTESLKLSLNQPLNQSLNL